jgi:hypothetical protein
VHFGAFTMLGFATVCRGSRGDPAAHGSPNQEPLATDASLTVRQLKCLSVSALQVRRPLLVERFHRFDANDLAALTLDLNEITCCRWCFGRAYLKLLKRGGDMGAANYGGTTTI